MLARMIIPALAAVGLAAPAQAQDTNTVYVVVDKSALQSQARLKHRIAVAVEQVCGSYATIESYQVPEVDDCRVHAWASANHQLAALSGEGLLALRSR